MSLRRTWPIGLTLLAIVAATLAVVVTRWGPFVSDDSYHYIKPVRDALDGLGFNPSPIFPPALPLVLLPLGWMGIEPLEAIRWLNAFLFGANVVLAGLVVRRMGASTGFALLAALWVASAEPALDAHAWAMSEALSITFTLLAIYLTLAYFESLRAHTLIFAAAAASLACLARYAALPIVGAIAVIFLIFPSNRKLRHRLGASAAFSAISLAPVVAYLQHSAIALGRPLYYPSYTFQPFTQDNLIWYLYNTLNWFVPGGFLRGHEIAAGLVALLALAALAVIWRRMGRARPGVAGPTSPGLWLLGLYVFLTYLLLYLARGLDWLAVYNPRYLVPPLLVALLAIVYLIDRLWRAGGRPARTALAAACVAFSLYYGYRAADYARQTWQTGLGYLNRGWHESETVPYLLENPGRTVIATGDVGIYFWTGSLPTLLTRFESMEAMRSSLCQTDGMLVLMSQLPPEIYHLDEAEVIQGLELELEFNDSRIYRCR